MPASRQPKPSGHWPSPRTQLSTQCFSPLESLAQLPLLQSGFDVHVAPRPPVTSGPATQRPPRQTSPAVGQSPSALHGLPMITEISSEADVPNTSKPMTFTLCVPFPSDAGALN